MQAALAPQVEPIFIEPSPAESWNICVMTRGTTFFANTEGNLRGFETMAPGALWDTGRLLADVGQAFAGRTEGLLIVPALPGGGEELHEPVSLASRWAAMEAAAVRAGWKPTGDGERIRDTGWITFRHLDTDRAIYMGVLTNMDQSRTPLFDLAADAETITRTLISYASVTGVLWRMTAGVSGCAAIRANMAERAQRQLTLSGLEPPEEGDGEPFWRWDSAPPDVHGAGHMVWARALSPAEKAGSEPRVITYDVRAQFLAAMAGMRYGWGKPVQRKAVPFDPERAGFWLIANSGPLSLGGPPIVRVSDNRNLTWVTTPVMVYLYDQGIQPMVYDSWTSATSSQWLKPWAQEIRNALYADSDYLREIEKALKRTYSETNGMFNVPGGSIFRRDLHWTTVDGGTMNLRRKIDHVHQVLGVWPCEVYHDAVSYPVLDVHGFMELNKVLGVAYPSGPRISIGKFKYVGAITVADWERKQWNKERRNG